jgi:PLD-like domain
MLKFLHGTAILTSAKKVIEDGESIDLAVAYWGDGAIKLLGISGSKPMRIICDLLSGGCNPKEVEKFLKPPFVENVEIRHLSGLHAKVYWTPSSVIVGSINASTNGLGDERNIGLIEAALQADSPDVLNEVQHWFEKRWEDAKDTPVDNGLLKKALKAWNDRLPPPNATVLSVLLQNPSWFRKRVSLVYIDDPASNLAKSKFRKIAANHYSSEERESWEDGDEPFYQAGESQEEFDKNCKPGDYIINCCHKDAPVSAVKEPGSMVISKKDCIVLLSDNRQQVLGMKFPKKERKLLHLAVEKHLKKFRTSESEFRKAKDNFSCFIEELKPDLLELIKREYPHAYLP